MVKKIEIGKRPDGTPAWAFEISNRSGASVTVLDRGCTVQKIFVPDRNGVLGDIAHGQDTLEAYGGNAFYKGAIMGRIANVVTGGSFEVNSRRFQLEKDARVNASMHSGSANYADRFFTGYEENGGVTFYLRDQGDGGFETVLNVWISFFFLEDNMLDIIYRTLPEEDTAVNMTCHAYFNLGDSLSSSVLKQELQVNADYYTADVRYDSGMGVVHTVEGTRNDFREGKPMGTYLTTEHPSYNTSFAIRGTGYRHAASVYAPESGRTLDVYTDMPGMMFFGAGMDGRSCIGKGGKPYTSENYFCLETQYFPDSVNIGHFPTTIQRKGVEYISRTSYKFGVRE